MNNSIKGALAAVAGGALLLGGAGSLAYWSDNGVAEAGTIAAGSLALSDGTCDPGWVYASGSAAGSAVTTIVPGDSITKVCDFTITASGQHLTADLGTPSTVAYTVTSTPEPTTLQLDVDATYELDGEAVHQVTSADNDATLAADIVVTFPFGSAVTINGNDTQLLAATLDDLTVKIGRAHV